MPFYVYSGGNLDHKHESIQLLKILTPIRDHFRDSQDYCFAFINAKYENSDKSRQYDLILLEKSCISIIEMKDMSGNLSGSLFSIN